MDVYEISKALRDQAAERPEHGMGFQLATAVTSEVKKPSGVLLAGRFFIRKDLSARGPSEVWGDERRVHVDLTPPNVIPAGESGIAAVRLLTRRLFASDAPAEPPFQSKTERTDLFYRFTAFKDDRRILPDKRLAPGTYTTTGNDKAEVPSGLAAVGRYALPSPLPAIHVFRICPGAGTPVAYGTVRPNYGMAGGGVEAFFPEGTNPGTVRYTGAIPMK